MTSWHIYHSKQRHSIEIVENIFGALHTINLFLQVSHHGSVRTFPYVFMCLLRDDIGKFIFGPHLGATGNLSLIRITLYLNRFNIPRADFSSKNVLNVIYRMENVSLTLI